jgi:surfactin synthase thioesterase subunit
MPGWSSKPNRLNVFFLPFAGGSRYSYRAIEERAPGTIRVIPLEYPGRGARVGEPLLTDTENLVNDLYRQVYPIIASDPNYALFGHSMGGLMGYLLARKLISTLQLPAVSLIVSGTAGPAVVSGETQKRHLLADPEFAEEISQLNGCPPEILENKELLSYFMPILRADFTATESYVYREEGRLDIPITVITGRDELLETGEVRSWQLETKRPVAFHYLPGDHFFILKEPDAVIRIIAQTLSLI